jgi:hypothetical protein
VFSSIKAISQYKVEEILEMGIDGFWVGYEGTKSGYGKQQGRPVEDIFTEFREHGITILASMIVGFDYQNHDVVAAELDGLMKLKPSLSQILIYGPVPSTPFYDRIMEQGLLRDDYKGEPEKFYKRADGFTTMIKHPTLSPTQIEGIQQWCYEQDFQRLGPSIFRVVESWLLGYHKLKDSTNPLLRAKARFYAKEVRKSYPIFLAGRLLRAQSRHPAMDRRFGQKVPRGDWPSLIKRTGALPHCRGRGPLDRVHLKIQSFPTPELAPHGLSCARGKTKRDVVGKPPHP